MVKKIREHKEILLSRSLEIVKNLCKPGEISFKKYKAAVAGTPLEMELAAELKVAMIKLFHGKVKRQRTFARFFTKEYHPEIYEALRIAEMGAEHKIRVKPEFKDTFCVLQATLLRMGVFEEEDSVRLRQKMGLAFHCDEQWQGVSDSFYENDPDEMEKHLERLRKFVNNY